MAIFSIPLLVAAGVIAISGAVGVYYLSWTVESVEKIADETKVGLNLFLVGAAVFVFALGIGKIGKVFK